MSIMILPLVEHLIKSLVSRPDDVVIKEVVGGEKYLVQIFVASDDIRSVIGREGNTLRAVRSLVYLLGPSRPCDVRVEPRVESVE